MTKRFATVDGNEAVASVAYRTNEVIAIYPITPASTMGELSDAWAATGRVNLLGTVPLVVEMQSEGGAAGAVHGSLQAGAMTTTFTSSQGLLLMIPNMFKIAGELTPTVFHVAARTIATHALSIFGDHSDVMAVRSAGWAMLCSSSVQEAQDFALIAQLATLSTRVPFLHFFDGFRTSHEVNKIEVLSDDDILALLDLELVRTHRARALSPERPVLRGSAQNPDVFFQAREAANPFYLDVPHLLARSMEQFAARTGRGYRLFDYVGAPDAKRVIVVMGSGAGAVEEAVEHLNATGGSFGLLKVRLFRPFSVADFIAALPATTRQIAVLDRTKEPGAIGEPLYQDVVTALAEGWPESAPVPRVIGGRYGLSSKEFTPAMAAAVFAELDVKRPKRHFTVGITDDVTGLSLRHDPDLVPERDDVKRAVFFGLGSDGTVGANKNSVKIIGENTPLHAQGYFVYDSKKSGSVTVSHLRFGPRPIRSSYLVRRAGFVACHQFDLLRRLDVLSVADSGATLLLNSPYRAEEVWERIPVEVQEQIIEKRLELFVVDAGRVAAEAGLDGRINTVMQACFFALFDVLPKEEALEHIRAAIRKSYGRMGEDVLRRNFAAVDGALVALARVEVPREVRGDVHVPLTVPAGAPDFVQRVTAMILAGKGDLLPVSALPVDGTFPVGTSRWEKRNIAKEIPIWDAALCIECGLCTLVCPHAAIQMKTFGADQVDAAPDHFAWRRATSRELAGGLMTIQVAPEDCTGCAVCVDVCPAKSKEVVGHRAIDMRPKDEHLERERTNFEFFLRIPETRREDVKRDTVRGSQLLEPLFLASGACAGCGETPYLKLLSQLFGDRSLIANATGCSSIFGGNLPTTPWSANRDGRGPAWSNSLFEDNAEFGLGMRLALDQRRDRARDLVRSVAGQIGEPLARELLDSTQDTEHEIGAQRVRVAELKRLLGAIPTPQARELLALADDLVRRTVWIVGGDGWAYDIGFGGLDHVLSSGRDVNILVLDTGVYSNTGGQASKATPRGAVARFAAAGRRTRKKDLGLIAMTYGEVYVAQIAMGANPAQTVRVFSEAESFAGPSLILAYSHCIAHGIEMATSMTHQKEAATSGFWPLYRHDPRRAVEGGHALHLDSGKPTTSFAAFAQKESRFAGLTRSDPEEAARLMALAQVDIDEQRKFYERMEKMS
jgi:pyruvate-ferredoxin/flavodoxin oxidoreductase